MWVAMVSAQSAQTARQPAPTSPRQAQSQSTPPRAATPAPEGGAAASGGAAAAATQRALLDQYCVSCHNARLKTANLLLDQFDVAHIGDHAEVGEKIVRKLRAGLMPP